LSSFFQALKLTLKFEGGYVNHPNDPGGETMKGITKRVARANGYRGEMKDIPVGLVDSIYQNKYWKPSKADKIHDQRIANYLFDTSVNCGVRGASKILQKSFNNISKTKLKVDGKIGPMSLKAINGMGKIMFNAFVTQRIKYYDAIILKNPKLKGFKRGWYIRAFSF